MDVLDADIWTFEVQMLEAGNGDSGRDVEAVMASRGERAELRAGDDEARVGRGAGPGCMSLGSSAGRDRARSTRSTGSCGPRRSRMSAGGRSSSRSTARSPGPGANWRPTWWSSKYFYGDVASGNGSPAEGKREYSVRQLVDRVTRTIADWGKEDGYFATAEDAERFYDELTALCLHQYGSFNSPVWFNVGLFHRYGISGPANNFRWDEETRAITRADSAYQYPQASACFIQSVSDDMEGIMRLANSEAMLFKFGSGTGHRPLHPPLQPGEALRRRQAVGARQLHAGL